MIRLQKISIPKHLKESGRDKELIGDTINGLMPDCVYNNIIAGDYDDFELPKVDLKNYNLPAYLKDYQKEDLSYTLGMENVFNINKPGYGKTLETIMWIKFVLKDNFKVLILCPKSVIGTWEEQLKKFWPDYLDHGMWWITNYEQLYNNEVFMRAKAWHWSLIVLDESHKIKSMKSKINNAVFQLEADHRHCLTGTPIKNRPQDLAAQLKWLDPYSITNFTDFQFAFCDMQRDQWGWKAKGLTKNKTMVANLQRLLDMYCIGGKEHDIGNIDQPEYIKVRLKMDPKVKNLYIKTVGEYDELLDQKIIDTEYLLEHGVKVTSAIEAAVRLQQLASNPQLFDEKLKNVKFEWIEDWLEGTDEKVVIFSKYAQSIDALEKYLKNKKIPCERVRKEQKPEMRQAAINRWNKSDTQVLLGTFGVLGTGVDGLQNNCRYVIFLDREWTASDNEQAEKRVWRTGQTRKPIFYILQCIGSIDIRIERTQLDKGHDAQELLNPVMDDDD